ncbi:MAG: inositol 2-dehydrogenase [Candidatus Aminicenantes bacterium]|nr:inositol 2-dehydrogenase [Candidatus Aminicenantes bacterium]
MNKIYLGLIGAGRIGQLHAENIVRHLREAELLMVADIKMEKAQKLANSLGIPGITRDYQELLMDQRIQAVIVCSSTDTHAEIIKASAEARKHVFCEKPLALDLIEINEILKEVAARGVKLQVGFNRRFDPSFRQIRYLSSQGAIGKPHLLKITSRDPAPPPLEYLSRSGGLFLDMTIHDFDMARFLINDEVEEVFAVGEVLIEPQIGTVGDVDTAVVILRFRNKAMAIIDNSRQAVYGYDQRIELFGERGMIWAGNPKPHLTILTDSQGDHAPPLLPFFVERYRDSYLEELKQFIDCLQENKEPPVTGYDGKMAVLIGYAAKKSFLDRRPVRLAEIDSEFGP